MSAGYDLSEESLNEIINKFAQYIEEVDNGVISIINKYKEFGEKTNYEIIELRTNDLVAHYNEFIKKTVLGKYNEWIETGESFVKNAKKAKVGEEAEENARAYQNKLGDILENSINNIDPIKLTNKLETKFDPEKFEVFESEIDKVVSDLQETIETSSKSNFEYLKEENTAAVSIITVANFVGNTIFKDFKEITKKINSKMTDFVIKNQKDIISSSDDEVKEYTEKTEAELSSERESLISEISNFFDDLD